MKISREWLKSYAELVNSPGRRKKRGLYWKMYSMLNGGAHELISEAIRNEFKDPQAVAELQGRLVSINIMKKVVNKLGGLYLEAPVRSPVDENETDADLLEDYEDITKINIRQKQVNRYLEAFSKNLKEIFAGGDGKVYIKNLPPFSYEVFNVTNPDKSQPDVVCKIIAEDDSDVEKTIYHWFSDESFWITNGKGEVIRQAMIDYNNPTGKNPSKVLPFVYKCKSTDTVDPMIDDSLYRISIALPIVLTDLFFACKYQCWSMIYTIGVTGEINSNPASVVSLQYDENNNKPEIGTISPKVDSDKVLKMVEATLNMFLSSKGLSGSTISLGTNAQDVVSGVSKALDSAEVIEGKKDQQDELLDDEVLTWDKIKTLVPYWRRNQMLTADLNKEFSKTFRVSIAFKDPKPMITEKEAIEISDMKIKKRFSTYRRELSVIYPDYNSDQIDDLIAEIIAEQAELSDLYNPIMAVNSGVQPQVPAKPKQDI